MKEPDKSSAVTETEMKDENGVASTATTANDDTPETRTEDGPPTHDDSLAHIPCRPYGVFTRSASALPGTVSLVGLGCSSFSGFFGNETNPTWLIETATKDLATIDPQHPLIQQWVATIHYAIVQAGITLLDTAPWYGHGLSEQVVGLALEQLFDDKSHVNTHGLTRSDLIINTKVGRYDAAPEAQFDFSRAATQTSLQRSLARLRTSYIDVWQLHDAEFAPTLDILLDECIPVMVQAKRDGHCNALGLTGYPLAVQRQIFQATLERFPDEQIWDQSLTYGHYTLHDQTLLGQPNGLAFLATVPGSETVDAAPESTVSSSSFAEYCAAHQCVCLAAAPLSMGLLTPSANPPDWHPASPSLREACTQAAALCCSAGVDLASLALLVALAEPRIPVTLVGCKDISQIQTLQHVCQRLQATDFDLEQALTPAEATVYQTLCDSTNGPFAQVWKTGEFQWDGIHEVRQFWKQLPHVKTKEWQTTDW